LAKIQEAKKALEEQALAAAQAEEAHRRVEDDTRRAAGETPRARAPVDPTPDPKAQRNFTDPESKIMKVPNLVLSLEGKGFDQCGNAQAVCNEEQIIVAADVTDQANDKRQVQPMVSQAQENLAAAGVEEKIEALDADSGYYSEENVSHWEGEKIDPYIATQRLKHHEKASCASDPDPGAPGPAENLTPKACPSPTFADWEFDRPWRYREGGFDPQGLHYRTGLPPPIWMRLTWCQQGVAGVGSTTSPPRIRGGGCAGSVSLSFSRTICCSYSASVYRGITSSRPSVVGMCTSTI
jgi:hypothetical protein